MNAQEYRTDQFGAVLREILASEPDQRITIVQNNDGYVPLVSVDSISSSNNSTAMALYDCAEEPSLPALFPVGKHLVRLHEQQHNLPLDAFLPRQRPMISALLHRQDYTLTEEILCDEWSFERQRLFAGLDASLCSASPATVVIQNAQMLGLTVLDFLSSLSQNQKGCCFLLVTNGNMPDLTVDSWNQLIEHSDEQDSFIQLGSAAPQTDTGLMLPEDTGQALATGKANLQLYALPEARQILQQMLHEHNAGSRIIPDHQLIDLYLQLGRIAVFQQDWDECIGVLQHMAALAQNTGAYPSQAHAYWRMGIAFLRKDNTDEAERMAVQTRNIAKRFKLELEDFYADFLHFLIEDQRRFQSIPEFEGFFTSLLNKAKQLNLHNTFAFISTNPFGIYSAYSDRIAQFHQQGLEIAAELENDLRLADAHQTLGLAHAVMGDYKKTLREYQMSMKIRERLGDPVGLAGGANGMGFYHLMSGDYGESSRLFGYAMQNLRLSKEYHEISMTLFNLALCSILSLEYSSATKLLQQCAQLLRILGRSNMAYHSRFGLNVLHGAALALSGKPEQARRLLNRLEMRGDRPFEGKNEEFFWHAVLLGVLAQQENDSRETQARLTEAEDYLFRTNDRIDYMAPFFFWLKAELNIDREANRKRCTTEALQRRNSFYTALCSGGKLDPAEIIDPDLSWIHIGARMQRRTVHLHQRIEEIRFLNELQGLLMSGDDSEKLIRSAVDRIYSNFPFTKVYYFSVSAEEEVELLTFRAREEKPDSHIQDAVQNSLHTQHQRILKCSHSSRKMLRLCVGTVPDIQGQIVCIPEHSSFLDRSESLQVLNIAAQQLSAALDRIGHQATIISQWKELKKKNLLLERLSTTDSLTGLGNRAALYQALRQETTRMLRYQKGQHSPCSVLFIDMDNFKEINDTLGHAAGDLVLTRTARVITDELRETDMAFRYGGDEFVVILPETPSQSAQRVADRIRQSMVEHDSFQHELMESLQIHTPPRFSCPLTLSIGITQIAEIPAGFDPEILLDQADRALYTAKRTGKDTSVVYEIDSSI